MQSIEIATEPVNSRTSSWQDSLGIIASIGCAIHCAAMPFVIAYLPALGLSFLADEDFHQWMALICFLIAIAAFVPGLRKHGNRIPISVGAFGLAFITFAAFGLAGECCPSCESIDSNSVQTTATELTESSCEACADCQSCSENQDAIESENAKTTSNEKDLLATLAPWLTPFGGCLLVSAHLLNRRFGCDCC